jgi:acyl-CoA synthetase (AMP-forming)/AMP-acid ligase II/peptidoglycan/LPS O-acetylase OafA/YrhL
MERPDFAARLEQWGDRIALVDERGEALSYAGLAAEADDLAARLGEPRHLIILEAANDRATIVALMAGLRAGHVLLLSAPDDAKTARLAETFGAAIRVRSGQVQRLAEASPALHDDLALLLSTSGTTGATKLVRLSAVNLQSNASSIADYLGISEDDRAITSLAPHYSYGLSVINSHLASGARLVLTDASIIEPQFRETFVDNAATSVAGVPYSYELFERSGFRDWAPASLRTMTQAGGRLPVDMVERYRSWCEGRGVRLFVMYGQTEATARIAYMPPEMLAENQGAIGRAIPGGELRLVDPKGGEIKQPDVEGELVYRGRNVMLGYAMSAADLAHGREVEELRTGDLAVRQPNGLLRITGRRSRFVKPFGLRVSLDELETKLRALGLSPAVTGTDELVAIAYSGDVEPDAVRKMLASELLLPESLFAVDQVDLLPTLASGKIDYRAILAGAEERARQQAAPAGLLDVFRAAFPGRQIDGRSSFVGLAGDSLNYVVLAGEIENRLGRLPQGWETIPVADLEALAGERPPASRFLRWVDSEMLLRALAIVAIVINHASDAPVGGGVEALLLLVGFNLARFQHSRFVKGGLWTAVGRMALRVLVPYYLLLLLYSLLRDPLPASSWLLASNFTGRFGTLLEPYWFIEALFQSLLLLALLGSLRPVQRLAARSPLGFGAAFFGVAVAVKIVAGAAFAHEPLLNRTPDQIIFLVALGWLLFFARSQVAKLGLFALSLILAADQFGWFALPQWETIGGWNRGVWLPAAAGLLLYLPRLPVPAPLRSLLVALSAASFTIYMLHILPIHVFEQRLGLSPWLVIPLTLAAGYAVHVLIGAAARRLRGGGTGSPARRGAQAESSAIPSE